eukprot:1145430-Pelagomonas_calceolata.AAC.4
MPAWFARYTHEELRGHVDYTPTYAGMVCSVHTYEEVRGHGCCSQHGLLGTHNNLFHSQHLQPGFLCLLLQVEQERQPVHIIDWKAP